MERHKLLGRRDDRAGKGRSRGTRRDDPTDDFAGTEITDDGYSFLSAIGKAAQSLAGESPAIGVGSLPM